MQQANKAKTNKRKSHGFLILKKKKVACILEHWSKLKILLSSSLIMQYVACCFQSMCYERKRSGQRAKSAAQSPLTPNINDNRSLLTMMVQELWYQLMEILIPRTTQRFWMSICGQLLRNISCKSILYPRMTMHRHTVLSLHEIGKLKM